MAEPIPRELRVRLEGDIRERLDEYAGRNRRTLTAAVNLLLAEALDESDRRHQALNSREG